MLPPPQRIGDELVSGEKHIVGGLVGKVLRNDEVLDRTMTRAAACIEPRCDRRRPHPAGSSSTLQHKHDKILESVFSGSLSLECSRVAPDNEGVNPFHVRRTQ